MVSFIIDFAELTCSDSYGCCGFTGVYRRREDVQVFIDITGIPDLRSHSISEEAVVIGGGVSLTETMEILTRATKTPGFEYCEHLVKHIDLIANVPVRNVSGIEAYNI